jgi:hypothetical protein
VLGEIHFTRTAVAWKKTGMMMREIGLLGISRDL